MKHIIFFLFISTTVFAQTPRLKFRQIQKDTTQGSIAISNPADSQLVFSRDFYISYGVDTVLILYGDTIGVGGTLDAEQVQDIVGAMVNAGLGLDVTYNDVDGELLLESLSIEDSVKNETALTILKGTPLYAVTTVGNYWSVAPADATDPAKMPVVAIAGEDLIAGATGVGLILGHIKGVNVPTTWNAGDEVWVGANGTFINHEPATEDTLIQRLGSIIKTGTNGSGIISIGDVNKNLNDGNIFIGDATGKVTTTQYIVDSTRLNTTGDTAFYYQNGLLIGSQEIAGGGGTSYNNISETADTVFITGDLNVDANTLRVDATTNKVGIGTSTPSEKLSVVGTTDLQFGYDYNTSASTIVMGADLVYPNGQTTRTDNVNKIAAFTMPHFDLDEPNVGVFLAVSDSANNRNIITFGDFSSTVNGPTEIRFNTSPSYNIESGAPISMLIDNNGNVGIGTSSPSVKLQVNGQIIAGDVDANDYDNVTTNPGFHIGVVDATAASRAMNLVHYGGTTGSAAALLRLRKSRGTSLGDYTKVENGDALGYLQWLYSNGSGWGTGGGLIMSMDGATGTGDFPTRLDFYTTNDGTASQSVKMVIKNNGNVGIGTTSPTYTLDVVGDINASGEVRNSGVILTSDARYKKDITPLYNANEKLMQFNPVSYYWNDLMLDKMSSSQSKNKESIKYGLVAQEVEAIMPEFVSEGQDGYKAIDYQAIITLLIKSNQEQQFEIDQLKTLITDLTNRIQILENK